MIDDLLPHAYSPLEHALSRADADSYTTVAFDPDLIRRVKDPARCPKHLLPYLAWERSVHEWDPAWPEWRQRDAVADSFHLHQRYGTRWGVERALDELGLGAEVDEWFEYASPGPYIFRVRVPTPDGWTAARTRTVYRVANGAKNARSRMGELSLRAPEAPALVPVGTAVVLRRRIVASTGTLRAIPLPPAPVRVGTAAVRKAHIYAVISEARTAVAFPAAGASVGTAAARRAHLYAKT